MTAERRAILAEPHPTNRPEDVVSGLVYEHARFLFRLAHAVLRNSDDAEDVVQETFVRVLKHREQLEKVNDVKAWLARIAWRITLSKKKNAKTVDNSEQALLADLQSKELPAEELVHGEEMKRLLIQLIASLPLDLREVLILSMQGELSAAQIGEILTLPETSVRTRLHRARKLLRSKLAGVLGESI